MLFGRRKEDFIDFNGLRLYCGSSSDLVRDIIRAGKEGRKLTIAYLNAHTYNLVHSEEELASAIGSMDILYADGVSIAIAAYLLYGKRIARSTAVDFFPDFLVSCQNEALRLYFLGTDKDTIKRAADRIQREYPSLKIAGYYDGYWELEKAEQIIELINASAADILIVGMGSPRQELFIARFKEQIKTPVIWAVGALFDYYGGKERPSPRWMGKIGLEWLYRLAQDPPGKWRRYIIGNWLFLFNCLKDYMKNKG